MDSQSYKNEVLLLQNHNWIISCLRILKCMFSTHQKVLKNCNTPNSHSQTIYFNSPISFTSKYDYLSNHQLPFLLALNRVTADDHLFKVNNKDATAMFMDL